MWYEQTMMVWTDLKPLRLHLRHREADEVRPFDELAGMGGAEPPNDPSVSKCSGV